MIAGVEVFLLIPVAAALTTFSSALFLFSAETRRSAFAIFVVSGSLFALFVPVFIASLELREYGFHLAAQRAEPLIAAIEAHVQERGRPPDKLEELVPRYLPSIPPRLPPLEIISGPTAREQFAGNDWILDSFVNTGVINWDRFMYFPNQQYPDSGYGGWIQRIGRWAYVHE